VSIDPVFERAVLAELTLSGRRAQRPTLPRALAERIHHGDDEALEHLYLVARAVSHRFRSVAWLHHASGQVSTRDLANVGLAPAEQRAVELLAEVDDVPTPAVNELGLPYAIALEPGGTGQIARIVACASLGAIRGR
jgi:hypothetical protein